MPSARHRNDLPKQSGPATTLHALTRTAQHELECINRKHA